MNGVLVSIEAWEKNRIVSCIPRHETTDPSVDMYLLTRTLLDFDVLQQKLIYPSTCAAACTCPSNCAARWEFCDLLSPSNAGQLPGNWGADRWCCFCRALQLWCFLIPSYALDPGGRVHLALAGQISLPMQAYVHNVSVYAELFGVRLHSHFLLVTYGNTPNTVGKDLPMLCFVLYSYSIRALVVSCFSTLF